MYRTSNQLEEDQQRKIEHQKLGWIHASNALNNQERGTGLYSLSWLALVSRSREGPTKPWPLYCTGGEAPVFTLFSFHFCTTTLLPLLYENLELRMQMP
jgi:hypothetical protein